ncbi:hypothetical protein PDENDC454_02540 [Paenibacillus dendritiformis C454]|uniref:EF-hand domain-containing protein n=1 Tax=Paenibacillus dendritiformis C454 TaxID=1131935 RepID=H3SAH3_9BACL|nr:hypothetical protein [Paenibacillus dendritiformis]EHQ63976.1 hypothetical protein PDENDC454_02540 [Paenibacillus dendritiformis C454]
MAKVGEQIKHPETGWKRYDDSDGAITYFPDAGWGKVNHNDHYLGAATGSYTKESHNKLIFSFVGTKMRLILAHSNTYSDKIQIKIDGNIVEYFSARSPAFTTQILSYEKLGLKYEQHTVEVAVVNKPTDSAGFDFRFDAIDIDDNGQLLHFDEVNDIAKLRIGKKIRCHYKAAPNSFGTFSGLGKETSDFLAPTTSSATPNGDFYFICVDKDHLGRWKLIADRNLQHSISWNTLNSAGVASGSGLPVLLDKDCLATIRLIEGGIGIGKDNEWDEYIVNSNLKGLISAGDNRVWNFKDMKSWTSSSWHDYSEMRTVRGASLSYENPKDTRSVVGFRPVLLLAVKYIRNIFVHNNTYKTYNNGWRPISTTLPSKNTFMNEGMSDLSVLDRKEQLVSFPMTPSILGEGRLFKVKVDYKKYFDVNGIDVK